MDIFSGEGFVLTSIMGPRMILFPFVFGLWLLAWSLRFVPRHRLNGAQRGPVAIAVGAIVLVHMIVEFSLYRFLTGEDNLKDDNFFFAVIMVEYIVSFIITLNSESVLKQIEAKDPR